MSLVNGGQKRHSFIAVEDVADFTVGAVDAPSAIGRRLVLGGPDALSWTDIVAKTSEILGASLEQQDVVIDATEVASLFGVTLTPAETVLRRALSSAA